MTSALDLPLPERLAASGRPVPMPFSTGEIVSLLLHLDEITRARSLVVEFPPGFRRLEAGRYTVGEELFVLSGALELDGRTIKAGDWCWVPADALRTGFGSTRGAITYAWFSGRNDFVPAPSERTPTRSRIRSHPLANAGGKLVLRDGRDDSGPGRSAVISAGEEMIGAGEVLDLASYVWARLAHNQKIHAGSAGVLMRWDTA